MPRKETDFAAMPDEDFYNPTTKSGVLRRWAMDQIEAMFAAGIRQTNIRFLYYEAVTAGLASKRREPGRRRPDQNLTEAITALRKRGDVPWNLIEDRTRTVNNYTGYPRVLEGIRRIVPHIRLDRWGGESPLLIVESESLGGTLDDIANEYGVILAPIRGQCRGFLETKIVPLIQAGHARVLYLGDADKAGGDIQAATLRVLERSAGVELDATHVAITGGQIEEFDLPVVEKYDERTKSYHDATECEALGQERLLRIVRASIESLGPLDVAKREKRQRREVLKLLC